MLDFAAARPWPAAAGGGAGWNWRSRARGRGIRGPAGPQAHQERDGVDGEFRGGLAVKKTTTAAAAGVGGDELDSGDSVCLGKWDSTGR